MIDPNTLNLSGLEQQYGLPAGLLAAVMKQESGGSPNAVSPKGATGLFQFMPETAQQYGINPLDPIQSAQGAARMYGDLSKQFGGDVSKMLAAYNWGSGNLTKQGIQNAPQETRDYIASITAQMGQPQTMTTITPLSNETTVDPMDAEIAKLEAELGQSSKADPIDAEIAALEAELGGPSFVEKVSQDWKRRKKNSDKIIGAQLSGEQKLGSTLLQEAGQGAAAIGDVAGNAASAITPEFIKEPLSQAAQWVADSKLGRGASALHQYGEQNAPVTTRNIDALANIASLTVGGVGTRGAVKPVGSALESLGTQAVKSGERSSASSRKDFVKELILPRETPRTVAEQSRVEVGPNRRQETVLEPFDQNVLNEVAQIQDVKSGNSLLGNENVILKESSRERNTLSDKLKKMNVAVADDDIINEFAAIRQTLEKNPHVIGTDGKLASAADQTINNALDIIFRHPQTADGLLAARKEFDDLARSQKPNVFDASGTDTPIKAAINEVRRGLNNIIAKAAPGADVKKSLNKQHALLTAAERISEKRAHQPTTRAGRFTKKIGNVVATKSALGAGAGLIGLQLAGLASPVAATAAAGGALYGLGKLAAKPEVRKTAGSALRAVGKAIK